jgi:hypothetical protein
MRSPEVPNSTGFPCGGHAPISSFSNSLPATKYARPAQKYESALLNRPRARSQWRSRVSFSYWADRQRGRHIQQCLHGRPRSMPEQCLQLGICLAGSPADLVVLPRTCAVGPSPSGMSDPLYLSQWGVRLAALNLTTGRSHIFPQRHSATAQATVQGKRHPVLHWNAENIEIPDEPSFISYAYARPYGKALLGPARLLVSVRGMDVDFSQPSHRSGNPELALDAKVLTLLGFYTLNAAAR